MLKKKLLKLAAVLASCVLACSVAGADELKGKDAGEVVAGMGIGFNIGNTFDSTGTSSDVAKLETTWGNPAVTQEFVDAVAAAGYKTVRLPVTWDRAFSDKANFTINPDYLARVKEVIDYCYKNDMYVILNVHHESWVNDKNLEKNYLKIGYELTTVWSQIAEYFADYDQHLIFEGMNEPRKAGASDEWTGNEEAYKAVQYLVACFANAVRDGKGNNDERCLMLPGYAASNSTTILNSITVPTVKGEPVKNVIASVHCYAPYNFCLSDNQKDFDPNKAEDTAEINKTFDTIKSIFLDNGIPAVIGETSATSKNNLEAREKWARYMGTKSKEYGVPIVIWDNGNASNSGGESHAYISRKNCKDNFPSLTENLFGGYNDAEAGSALKGSSVAGETSKYVDGADLIFSNADGKKIEKDWDASQFSLGAKPEYIKAGGDVIVVYEGNGVNLILDSEIAAAWWIQIAPTKTEEKDGKQLAYFSYDDCMKVMGENNVTAPSQLRNFMLVSTDGGATIYEISSTGTNTSKTYMAMGTVFATGDSVPAETPEYPNMKFLGWYSTKNYAAGSEYNGGECDSMNIYAKFELDVEAAMSEDNKPVVKADPTKAPTKEPTVEPTKEPTKEATAEPTKDASADDSKNDESKDEASGSKIWIPIVAAVVVVCGAVCGVVVSKKKKSNKNA